MMALGIFRTALPIFILSILNWTTGATTVSASGLPPAASKVSTFNGRIEFEYESSDGEIRLTCKHQEGASGSNHWKVICGEGTPLKREFGVHLLIRRYVRTFEPRLTLEILYWVTDRSAPQQRQFTGTSQWISFLQEADLHSIRLSEGIENHYASLTLTISK